MKILKYKYNPDKKGVFKISVVKNPAVGEGDMVLMSAVDIEPTDGPITTYADMIVKNADGQVLLLQRNPSCEFEPNKWGFPGGKVMPGETTQDGAVRECLEECGITVDPSSIVRLSEISNGDSTTSHYFSGTPTNSLTIGDEHQNFAWVNCDDLDDYELILDNIDRYKSLLNGTPVIMSAQEIKGVFYSPVMIPDLKIDRVDPITGEPYQVYYGADTVEQLANNYWKQCGNANTNIEHSDDVEGVYPVESWIVKDPINDKSNALGMPLQTVGTWIMGYKCESPEILDQVKNNLLQGLSIEGHLDAVEEMSVKFSKLIMSKPSILERLESLVTKMSATPDATPEKTPEEIAAEKKAAMAATPPTTPSDAAAEEAAETPKQEAAEDSAEADLATAQATIAALEKKVADLTAQLAQNANDATLMSAQLVAVEAAFDKYKAVQMSAQKLGDQPVEKPVLTPIEEKQSAFLKMAQSKL